MKTAISIPDPLFKAADDLAEQLGISRSQLYQRAVELYLRARGQELVREALNEVYGGHAASATIDGASRLDPAIEYLQGTSLDPGKGW